MLVSSFSQRLRRACSRFIPLHGSGIALALAVVLGGLWLPGAGVAQGAGSSWDQEIINTGNAFPLAYPLDPSTVSVSLPTLPDSGIIHLWATSETAIPVDISGQSLPASPGGTVYSREYHWTQSFTWTPAQPPTLGKVFLRWYWNDEPIPDIQAWLTDGSNGKWGSYRVEVWQSMTRWGSVAVDPEREEAVLFPGTTDYYEIRQRLAVKTFQVTVQGQTPLAAGTPPTFDVTPVIPATVLVGEAPVTLSHPANAGAPFRYRWFRDAVEVHSGPSLTVTPAQVNEIGSLYRLETRNSDGTATTPTFRIRRSHRPAVKFDGSSQLVKEGETITLIPTVQSGPGNATLTWTGPALAAADGRATVIENGTLKIRDARLEDSGTYEFTATDVEGSTQHSLSVLVLGMPTGAYPLGVGQVIRLRYVQPLPPDITFYTVWETAAVGHGIEYTSDTTFFTCLRARPSMAGDGWATVQANLRQPYDTFSHGVCVSRSRSFPAMMISGFSLELPTQRAVMPAHSLPPGQVALPYSAPSPVFVVAANAPTRFTVSGLPRGLKATPLGALSGTPTQSGDFSVRFTAINAKGKAAPVEVPLHIAPLPEAVAGDWIFSLRDINYNAFSILRVTILPTGAYSGKKDGTPIRGVVQLLPEGRVVVQEMEILPGTHYARAIPDNPLLYVNYTDDFGWRNTWGKKAPVGPFEGRYNFHALPPQPQPGSDLPPEVIATMASRVPIPQGHISGSVRVSPSGVTSVTHLSAQGQKATLSSAFLGPQGEVHHQYPHLRGERFTQNYALHLKLDETGTRLSGDVPAPAMAFQSPGYLDWYEPSSAPVLLNSQRYWPLPYIHRYQGGRYTPPEKKALPVGYSSTVPANAHVLLRRHPNLVEDQVLAEDPLTVTLRSTGQVLFPPVSPTGLRLTAKVHLPTGTLSGTARLPLPEGGPSRPLKYQGHLVPQENGPVLGYGRLMAPVALDPWWTRAITLTPSEE